MVSQVISRSPCSPAPRTTILPTRPALRFARRSNSPLSVPPARLENRDTQDSLDSLKAVPARKITQLQMLPRLEFEASAGEDYQIVVDSSPGGMIGIGLSVFPVPPNDHFINRIALEASSNVVHAAADNASREIGEPVPASAVSLW